MCTAWHHIICMVCEPGLRPCHARPSRVSSIVSAFGLSALRRIICISGLVMPGDIGHVGLRPLSASSASGLRPRWQHNHVLSRTHGRKGRTESPPPMGPPPTHVCLVRETRLLPPKAGRLASRSASKGSPLRDRIPWLSKGHVALALSGGCECPSSGSCSLWVVRVVTLIPLGP